MASKTVLTQRREGRKVGRDETQLDLHAHGALNQPSQIRRAQHRGHAVRGERDRIFWHNDEGELSRRADFGLRFYFKLKWVRRDRAICSR